MWCNNLAPRLTCRAPITIQIPLFCPLMLPSEIPLVIGRLCLDSSIPVLVQVWHWPPEAQCRSWMFEGNVSGPNLFRTHGQVKWPFSKTSCKSVEWRLSLRAIMNMFNLKKSKSWERNPHKVWTPQALNQIICLLELLMCYKSLGQNIVHGDKNLYQTNSLILFCYLMKQFLFCKKSAVL